MINSRLIVNADDFGKSEDVNRGIVESFKSGRINQTSVMVNMPFVDEAVRLAKDNGFFDKIGLHLNLTEGEPLTEDIRGCDRLCTNGIFSGTIIPDLRHGLKLTKAEYAAIEKEISAQIDKYIALGFPLMHLDSHHHVHNEYVILKIVTRQARNKGFKSMRIARNMMQVRSVTDMIKKLYKYAINRKIRGDFKTTELFGSMQDYQQWPHKTQKTTEVMVHPTWQNGEVFDIVVETLVPLVKIL